MESRENTRDKLTGNKWPSSIVNEYRLRWVVREAFQTSQYRLLSTFPAWNRFQKAQAARSAIVQIPVFGMDDGPYRLDLRVVDERKEGAS